MPLVFHQPLGPGAGRKRGRVITRKNILYSAFIGLAAEIVNSGQRSIVGLRGTVVDETKNMVHLELEGGRVVRVQKAGTTFRFTAEDGDKVEIDGRRIAFRPHERPKKV